MNKTSQQHNSGAQSDELTFDQEIDKAAQSVEKTNAELEAKYGKYLKDDYVPEGYDAKGLKDKVDEATDQKEQEDLAEEIDNKIAEIMSDIIDMPREEE